MTSGVVPGELTTRCGLLGPWVRGHRHGLGPRTRLVLGHLPVPQCGTAWFPGEKQ